MPGPSAADFLAMFREFASLDKRRASAGLSPLEFQRWSDLKGRLGKRFEQRGVGKAAKLDATRLRLDFETPEDFAAAQLDGLSTGDGVWVNTPFAVPVGRSFVARIQIASTGKALDLPCAVVSTNLSNDHSTTSMGMGVRFTAISEAQHLQLRELRGAQGSDRLAVAADSADTDSERESSP